MARYFNLLVALGAIGVSAITPEQMLSAPRRSEAIPNADGTLAFFSVSQYSFDEQSSSSSWQTLDLKSGDIAEFKLNSSDINELAWVPGSNTTIIYLNATSETPGGVSIWVGDILSGTSTLAGNLDAPFSGLKVAKTSSGDLNVLFNSLAYPNGTAYNEELAETPRTTGRLYSDVFVRHWDTWLTKQRSALFAATLTSSNSSYALSGDVKNLIQSLNYTVTRPETPVGPMGGSGDYDISPDGQTVAFLSKAPQLPKQNYTASYIYLVPFTGDVEPVAINGPDSEADDAGAQGASQTPVFSPDGNKLVYWQQDGISYESDKFKTYVVDIEDGKASNWAGLATQWDRSPSGGVWAPDSKSVYVMAEDHALIKAFNLPLDASDDLSPSPLTNTSSITAFAVLPDSSLLISASSLWSSRDFYVLPTGGYGDSTTLFASNQVDKELAGLGPEDAAEFWFPGSTGQSLQSWLVYPEGFSKNKTYPLAFIVHGGPQGTNGGTWSTRWNPKVWADQGYVVVAPNPTGSTSFGQNLTDAIQGDWGGAPYQDLVKCWEYVDSNFDFIDTEHGIEAGASYGGYMTNWIQANDLGRKFKALVTHDGVTNTYADYGTEEMWFIEHDFNGTIWEHPENYQKWNPLNHAKNFSTPHFVVHNSKDYRLPESEGIQMFNLLQELGVPSRFLSFPDENHWVVDPENSLFWHTEIFNWINHWSSVGGALDDNAIGF